MCPIFYPLSMVPERIRWVVAMNPLAMIIEACRNAILYGTWPSYTSMLSILLFSMTVFSLGYLLFVVSKPSFADVV
jgi:lipopolysaccharide transport system permease protein